METICGYSIDEYIIKVKGFHGHLAPGLLIGGFMVDTAMRNLPSGEFFDVLCETAACLPDAVQILTPCTYGNGWLKVVNVGRFALTFFEKTGGEGVRVYLDAGKLDEYAEIKNWFLKLTPKREQDGDRLIREITGAGSRILGVTRVQVNGAFIGKKSGGKISICPACGEAYPARDGASCLACQGTALY
jgi:formylmethanofuran dehydrogenase subunit E